MSNEISANENVANLEASYTSRDFNSDPQDSNNSEEVSDESPCHQATVQDLSNNIIASDSNTITTIISIQVVQDSELAIVSIGIKNAPPIIKTLSMTELRYQPVINDWLQELETFLPEMLAISKERKNNQDEEDDIEDSEQVREVQKRELPESKSKTAKPNNQLSLF